MPEILARCTPRTEDTPLTAPQQQPASHQAITADLLARIHAELDGRLHRLEADPPAWYDELTQHHPDPAARRAAAADVFVWRAVSGQDDADTALGKAPTEKDNTAHYHQAAHAALHPSPEDRPGDHDARHEALVSGLSDNWITLEPTQAARRPTEEEAAQHTAAAHDRDRQGWER